MNSNMCIPEECKSFKRDLIYSQKRPTIIGIPESGAIDGPDMRFVIEEEDWLLLPPLPPTFGSAFTR